MLYKYRVWCDICIYDKDPSDWRCFGGDYVTCTETYATSEDAAKAGEEFAARWPDCWRYEVVGVAK